ncbi:LGFP repeat-containing protein [Nocardia sp. NPDC004085]
MSSLQEKYQKLLDSGWGADPPEPFAPQPVGDGLGTWFAWSTPSGVDVAIYFSPVTGAAEVHGAILAEYRAGGGPQGNLGYPVTDEHDDLDAAGNVIGRVNDFQWGSVFWSRSTRQTTTMVTGPVVDIPNVAFREFLNHGVGLVGNQLGEVGVGFVYGNAVELQFAIQPAARLAFGTLRPIQWAGPSVTWVKNGNPATSPWVRYASSLGEGPDGPEPDNIVSTADVIAFYDSPGPNTVKFFDLRPSRIRAIQNFTAWISGTPALGGPEDRLCPVVAWYSIVDIIDDMWDARAPAPSWRRWQSVSALGWGDTSTTPP